MFCENCGKMLKRPQALFCPYCGNKINHEPVQTSQPVSAAPVQESVSAENTQSAEQTYTAPVISEPVQSAPQAEEAISVQESPEIPEPVEITEEPAPQETESPEVAEPITAPEVPVSEKTISGAPRPEETLIVQETAEHSELVDTAEEPAPQEIEPAMVSETVTVADTSAFAEPAQDIPQPEEALPIQETQELVDTKEESVTQENEPAVVAEPVPEAPLFAEPEQDESENDDMLPIQDLMDIPEPEKPAEVLETKPVKEEPIEKPAEPEPVEEEYASTASAFSDFELEEIQRHMKMKLMPPEPPINKEKLAAELYNSLYDNLYENLKENIKREVLKELEEERNAASAKKSGFFKKR